MKKVFAIWVILSLLLTILSGCQSLGAGVPMDTTPSTEATEPSTKPTETLNPDVLSLEPPSLEVRKEMRDAIWKLGITVDLTNYPANCNNVWYYGTINGCIVTFKEFSMNWEYTFRVAGYAFTNRVHFDILVYKSGEACTLREAFEKGWLTEDHIRQLHERHAAIVDEMDAAYDEWWQSQKET